uniref:(northern house mosquito) hypothetical protein n=1 Tax=Culex pipiens TaxID=7175 RepID=A0A8D8CJQ5_CULPI
MRVYLMKFWAVNGIEHYFPLLLPLCCLWRRRVVVCAVKVAGALAHVAAVALLAQFGPAARVLPERDRAEHLEAGDRVHADAVQKVRPEGGLGRADHDQAVEADLAQGEIGGGKAEQLLRGRAVHGG